MRKNSTGFTEDLGEAIGYAEAYAERKIQIAKLDLAERFSQTIAYFRNRWHKIRKCWI